ncbi:MAG: hypothetical protein KAV87_30225 [Desulfobacteraceae bacterium]|nr:hypothetical protein [Desulfobacteraceae bacterium]
MDNEEKESQKEPSTQEKLNEDEINLIDYFRVTFKYRKMVLWICGVVVVMTAIISLLSPKIYSATTSIVPPMDILQKGSAIGGLGAEGSGAVGSSILVDIMGVTSIADFYVGFLESRVIADAIIDRFDLMKVYEEKKYKSNVRKKLKKNTTIEVSDGDIVTITVEDRDPNRAAAVANAYVEELDRQNKRLSTGQATSKRVFLESRLAEIEEKLSNIENIPTREARIQEMVFELLTREYEIAKIEEAKSMPTIQILDRAIVPEVRMPRRTKRKVMLAGVVSLMLGVFVAFTREYFAKIRKVETKEQGGENCH